jgi:hypothetical protein
MSALTSDQIAYQKAHISENRGPVLVGVEIILIALCSLVLSACAFARRMTGVKLAVNDYLALAAHVWVFVHLHVLRVDWLII